jgi:hypothetical protein
MSDLSVLAWTTKKSPIVSAKFWQLARYNRNANLQRTSYPRSRRVTLETYICLVTSNQSYCSFLSVVRREQTNGYRRSFFTEVCSWGVLLHRGFLGCNSAIAPAAPSLRALVLSSSLMRCEPIPCSNPFFLCGRNTSESRRCLRVHLSQQLHC